MRRNRIILYSLFVISLVIISFYGGPISYGLFYLILLIPLSSLAYLLYVFFKFGVYQQVIIKDIVVGTQVPFYFTLKNDGHISFAGVKVRFFSFFSSINNLENDLEYELLPGTGITKETTIVCKYRGEYEIGIKTLEITDFFRLFTFKYKPLEVVRVKANPAIVYVDELRTLDMNLIFPKEDLNGLDYPDVVVRDYNNSDPMKLINWNATARECSLKVRKMIGEEKNVIGILMDTKRYSDEEKVYLPAENKVLEIVIALSMFLARRNISTRIHYLSPELISSDLNGLGRFNDFYATVSQVRFDKENDTDRLCGHAMRVLDATGTQIVVMVLQGITEGVSEIITQLHRDSVQVVIYLVGHEEDEFDFPKGVRLKVVSVPVDASVKEVL